MFKNTQNQKGFSLIELLVVVIIIMTLTTIAVVSYSTTNRNARNGKRQADMAQVRSALEVYRATVGVYPAWSGMGGTATAANFNTLVSTTASPAYLGPYLASTVLDPINDTNYFYSYLSPRPGGATSTYQLCYYSEPSRTQVCVYSP